MRFPWLPHSYIVEVFLKKRLINISLRVLVLVSRFFFLFIIARFLEPEDVGLYGVFVATVGYSLYFLGMDFYTYTTREIASSSRDCWGGYIRSQIFFSAIIYCFALPILLFVFYFDLLPKMLLGMFFLILVLEHLSLELIRFFIAASEQVSSTIVLFLNQASWAIIVTLLMVYSDSFRSLDVVLIGWFFGSLAALFFGFIKIKRMGLAGWDHKVDFSWLWNGVKIAFPLLLATLAYRGVFTLDRYFLSFVADLEMVASYILFFGVAGVLLAFLDAAVFSFNYPKMISAHKNNLPKQFKFCMRQMLILTFVFSLVFIIVSFFILPYLISWIGRDSYLQHYYVFYWALIVVVMNAFWMVFHYGLYAQGIDKPIIHSHIASFLIFLVIVLVLQADYGIYSVLLGLCLSQLLMLLWKAFVYSISPLSGRVSNNINF
ncbi:MATE family efflux transporter [Vibrio cholerae]|uniref:hypothetical protein n=1 Tax=Vibrio cholerae TaxID=666 RepID=UPI003966C2A4